jgi:uncharacterized phage protein (TIGR01671 family)
MRELKFRVWEKRCKRYLPTKSYHIFWLNNDVYRVCIHEPSIDMPRDTVVLQQFTGLKDKNDKEIYEGDIIQLEGSPISYSIEWAKYQWAINAHGALGYDPDWNLQPFNHCVYERAIVVGNIFENSNLLKQ